MYVESWAARYCVSGHLYGHRGTQQSGHRRVLPRTSSSASRSSYRLSSKRLSCRLPVAHRGRLLTSHGYTSRRKVIVTESRTYPASVFKVGRQLGEGSFGVVYEGTMQSGRGGEERVILKRAKPRVLDAEEMTDMERQLNEKLRRSASGYVADYLGSCEVDSDELASPLSPGLWLIWRFEGTTTLYKHLNSNNFAQDLIKILMEERAPDFGRDRGLMRKNMSSLELTVAQKVLQQTLEAVACLHSCGVVHRDVKPQNLLLSEKQRRFKLIDLGACADLRFGVNYQPNETILDPKYSPPEEYCLPQDDAPDLAAKAAPVAMALGARSWVTHNPDRFDMYSVGLVMIQLVVPSCRSDLGLQRFNREFKNSGYDLKRWRRMRRLNKKETLLLDLEDGAGWDLAQALLSETPKKRPSASSARSHRWFRCKIPLIYNVSPEEAEVLQEEESVTGVASAAMRDAISRLKRLESAVVRRQTAIQTQSSQIETMKEAKMSRREIEREEAKLYQMKKGLDYRLGIFSGAQKEMRRMLGISNTQIKRAEEAAEQEKKDAEAEQMPSLKAMVEEQLAAEKAEKEPGWGTRLKRFAGFESKGETEKRETDEGKQTTSIRDRIKEEQEEEFEIENESRADDDDDDKNDGDDGYTEGWGTKVRRYAGYGGKLGKFGAKIVSDVAVELAEEGAKAVEQAPPDSQAGKFLKSVAGLWSTSPGRQREKEIEESDIFTDSSIEGDRESVIVTQELDMVEGVAVEEVDAFGEVSGDSTDAGSGSGDVEVNGVEDVGTREVESMRLHMETLEKEVEMMAAKMAAMEKRLMDQGLMQQQGVRGGAFAQGEETGQRVLTSVVEEAAEEVTSVAEEAAEEEVTSVAQEGSEDGVEGVVEEQVASAVEEEQVANGVGETSAQGETVSDAQESQVPDANGALGADYSEYDSWQVGDTMDLGEENGQPLESNLQVANSNREISITRKDADVSIWHF